MEKPKVAEPKIQGRLMNYKTAMVYLGITSYTTLNKFIADGLKVTTIDTQKFIDKNQADIFIEEHTAK